MTPDAIRRVQTSYEKIAAGTDAISAHFYEELFSRAPLLRAWFPKDMAALRKHFDSAIALVVRNLDELDVIAPALRDLGGQHVHWGARPDDYVFAREALLASLRAVLRDDWSPVLEADWRTAVTRMIVTMIEGAAVETAVTAERLSSELI